MKLFMRLSSFWGGKFDVSDENGEIRYRIDSKTGFGGTKLFVRDYDGNEIVRTDEKGAFATRFDIYAGDLKLASMRRQKKLFDRRYYIDEFGWVLTPNAWSSKFTITDGAREIARFGSKGIFAEGYEIEVSDGVNIPSVLALVGVMSKVVCDEATTTCMVAPM